MLEAEEITNRASRTNFYRWLGLSFLNHRKHGRHFFLCFRLGVYGSRKVTKLRFGNDFREYDPLLTPPPSLDVAERLLLSRDAKLGIGLWILTQLVGLERFNLNNLIRLKSFSCFDH